MSLERILGDITRSLLRQDRAIEENKRLIVNAPLNAGRASRLTIAAGAITVTRPHVLINPETGTADNLDVINNFTDGKFVIIAPEEVGDVITVRDYTVSAGNIDLRGFNIALSAPNQQVFLYYVEETARWHLVTSAATGAVYSVNGQTGVVLLDSDDIPEGVTNLYFSAAEASKLAGIEAGAEVNVNADWDAVAGDALILNKPSSFPPGAHATSHQHGGADEVATSTPAANAIVKALGTGKIDNNWLDVELSSIAGLTSAADTLPYYTGSGTAALATLTPFARTILDDADAATVRATLGLVIGTNVQAFDATLLSIAALGTAADRMIYTTGIDTWAESPISTFGRSLIDDADAVAGRTTLGLGTAALENSADLVHIAGAETITGAKKFSAAPEVEMASANLIIDATTGAPLIQFQEAGVNRWRLVYDAGSNYFAISQNSVADWFRIADTTGLATFLGSVDIISDPSSPGGKLNVAGDAAGSSITSSRYVASANGATIRGRKSRNGTIGSHTILQDNDIIMVIEAQGSDGSAFQISGQIRFTVDGTPGASDMPGAIEFFTVPDGSVTPTLALTLSSAQEATFEALLAVDNGASLYMRDPDVAHGMTDVLPTDVWGGWSIGSGTGGGASFFGLSDGDNIGIQLVGITGSTTPSAVTYPISLVGAKKSGTLYQALGSSETMFALLNAITPKILMLGSGFMSLGDNVTPTARLHIQASAVETDILIMESVSAGDNPQKIFSQGRTTSTSGTAVTVQTITIPASTTLTVVSVVEARRTGGAAGAAEDGAAYVLEGVFKNVAGVATIISQTTRIIGESQAAWDVVFDVTGATARIRATGAANNNITWHSHTERYPVGS